MLPMFDLESQKQRGMMYRRIRDFFDGRGYLEIFTPTLSPTLIPEPTIQDFETRFVNEFVGDRDFYLIPSPEIFMYYTLGFDEKDSITLTRQLIDALLMDDCPSFMKEDFLVMSVNEAMIRWAGTDLEEHQDRRRLARRAEELGQSPAPDEAWDDIFNRIFITYVEPELPRDRIVVLTDYPYQIDCLAQRRPGTPWRSRWEMYIAGIEVANCYSEETDVEVTKAYYEKEYARLVSQRAGTGLPIPDVSDRFPTIEVPPSSGVAIGLDRLLMCLTGRKDIRDVLLFPFDRLMSE